MTWEQFLAIVKKHDFEETDALMMSGVVFDNGFRGLTMYKDAQIEAPEDRPVKNPFAPKQVRLTPKLWEFSCDQDFIWTGGGFIRCGGCGGHPALAMTDSIYCAGQTMKGGFFFHSGHYKPKRRHGLSFFVAFVKTCVGTLSGDERDKLVHHLCSTVWLQFYRPGTEGKEIEEPFTFCYEFEQKEKVLASSASSSATSGVSTRSSPMIIGGSQTTRSQPMPTGGTTGVPRSTPMPIGFGGAQTTASSSTSSTSSTSSICSSSSTYSTPPMVIKSKVDTSGESGYVKFVNDSPNVNLTITPVWIPDGEVTKCHKCQSAFGTFTRKHHCRQCGNIFCSSCCSKKKIVRNPAKNPKEAEDANKPLRVCNPCLALTKL